MPKEALSPQLFVDPGYWSGRDLNPRPPRHGSPVLYQLSQPVSQNTKSHNEV